MENKKIVIGITGSVAAFKAAQLVSNLGKKGYDIHVVMTKEAQKFIGSSTFTALTKNKVLVDGGELDQELDHLQILHNAEAVIIVPATANTIAKLATGICDNYLTTVFLAAPCPRIVCPAMNVHMWENPLTQKNLQVLRDLGVHVVDSEVGMLACREIGKGKLASLSEIEHRLARALAPHWLAGKKVLITAGPTIEAIDPVRFISNHSSGKMGYALALVANRLQAEVTVISGPSHQWLSSEISVVPVRSAREMYQAVMEVVDQYDIIVMAAAVGDFAVEVPSEDKIKKDQMHSLSLVTNPDILQAIGKQKKPHQIVIGFAMETTNLLENARVKLKQKGCDYLVANDLTVAGAGFQGDTNVVTIIGSEGEWSLPLMTKEEVAYAIYQHCCFGKE